MIALNIDGESLVNKAMEVQIRNKFQLLDLIRSAIFTISVDIERAKEHIIQAYELTQESLSHTFICVNGLTPLVLNEIADADNYNRLTIIHDQLYEEVYVQLFLLAKEKFSGNILSFQRAKINRMLRDLYHEICLMEPLNVIKF